MKLNSSRQVEDRINSYPQDAKQWLEKLRALIIATADETDDIESLDETLKWGEPSYLVKQGSTIRIDWKPSRPDTVSMYFHCQSKLIDTFKELYPDVFQFDGNRAIHFRIGKKLPEAELRHCILLALTYHKRKHLNLLGA